MELTREAFKEFDPDQVCQYVVHQKWVKKEEAEKLAQSQVKGSTLLRSSMQDVILFGLLPGPAKDLVDALRDKFPGGSLISVMLLPFKSRGSQTYKAKAGNRFFECQQQEVLPMIACLDVYVSILQSRGAGDISVSHAWACMCVCERDCVPRRVCVGQRNCMPRRVCA